MNVAQMKEDVEVILNVHRKTDNLYSFKYFPE